MLYRSGRLLANRAAGFFAASLMLASFYWLEMISGRQQLDQNDVAFLSYVSLSIWAFIEYRFTKKKIWLVLLGIFSGGAVLCKWLAGLFVYVIWGIYALLNRETFLGEIKNMPFGSCHYVEAMFWLDIPV